MRVLVCDDDKVVRDVVRDNLSSKYGYTVLRTLSGPHAIRTLQEATDQIDLVLLDYRMPAMDGMETYQRIREFSNIPVIIMTAYGSIGLATEFLKAGGADFIEKPIEDFEKLDVKIRSAVNKKRTRVIKKVSLVLEEEGVAPWGAVINTLEDVYWQVRFLQNLDRELCCIIHLDADSRVIEKELVSYGTLTRSLLHPREVFKSAIHYSSASIILAHNHTSGNNTPSEDDIRMTEVLRATGKLVGIPLIDHIIVGGGSYRSIMDEKPEVEAERNFVIIRNNGAFCMVARSNDMIKQIKMLKCLKKLSPQKLRTIINAAKSVDG